MDNILICLLNINISVSVILAFRASYWGWKFLNNIWIQEPEKAREYGIPSDSPFGSIELIAAIYSKEPCTVPELESFRTKTRKAGNHVFLSLVPFFLIILGFVIPRFLNSTPSNDMSKIDWKILATVSCVFMISITTIAYVYYLRRRKGTRNKN